MKNILLETPNETNPSDGKQRNSPIAESLKPKAEDTTIAEVKFNNKAESVEIYEEKEDSCRRIEYFTEKLTTASLWEDKVISSEISSVEENQNTKAFENNEQIEEIIQPVKKEIQIYGNSALWMYKFRIILLI